MKRIAVLFAEGFEEVEGLTQVDFLRRAGVEITVVGVTGTTVTGGHDVTIETDTTIDKVDSESLDGVVIPGGMPGAENVAASTHAQDLVKKLFKAGKLVAAICAAPAVVLEPLGVLEGKTATCYPGFEGRFQQAGFSEERVVKDGTVITSRGPGTAAEFAVALIEYLVDRKTADKIRSATLQPEQLS